MSGPLVWTLVALGLAVVALRRRSLAVGLVTVQALVLAVLAVREAEATGDLLAALALAARAVALGVFYWALTSRTRDPRPVPAGLAPLRRCALAVGTALMLGWLVPPVGLASRPTELAVLALVAFGLVLTATSRATVFQVLGIVLVENALAMAALALPGSSWLIEVGVALDLTLLAVVAGVFHDRIFTEFGSGDTAVLRSLRD